MKSIKSSICFLLLLLVALVPLNASAQLFGSDEENWEKAFRALKKINSRLITLETSEIAGLKRQLKDLLRQIEEVKQTLPQLQGSVELTKSETLSNINKIKSQINDLEAEVKNQVLAKIDKQSKILDRFQKDQKNLKKGLAQDIEQFEKGNRSTLERVVQRLAALDETTKKSFKDTKGLFISDVIPAMAKENLDNRNAILEHLSQSRETNEKSLAGLSEKNKMLIDILEENLKQGAETKEQIASISETLAVLKKGLIEAGEFDQLADEKINKLVENSAQLIANANKLEKSVLGELKQSSQKEDSNQDKIDLANEKLSRLIEILKAIATEQDKLSQVVKAQTAMNKAQAGLVKNQEGIKDALADLRRKANVSISRSDDIKKILREITKNNSGASSKSAKKTKNK